MILPNVFAFRCVCVFVCSACMRVCVLVTMHVCVFVNSSHNVCFLGATAQ